MTSFFSPPPPPPPGGWKGNRAFVVSKKEAETGSVASFYLKPKDGGPIIDFKPGQYVTVRVRERDQRFHS